MSHELYIHHAQGLKLYHLTFDLTNVTRHNLTYTTISKKIPKKLYIYFYHCLISKQKIAHFKKIGKYELAINSRNFHCT